MSGFTKFGVIGAGNGGLAIAAQLGLSGKNVTVYDIFPDVLVEINKVGGIHVNGKIEGFGKVQKATNNLRELVEASEIIMVVVPAIAHKAIAKEISEYITDDKIIVLCPGSTGGSLEFYKELYGLNPKSSVIIAETQSLFYACRSEKIGKTTIYGIKKSMGLSAFPAVHTQIVIDHLSDVFPQLYKVESVLKTGLENINAIVHPIPTLLNAGLIDSGQKFKYYWEGITPKIGLFLEEIDQERMQIGKAFGLELKSTINWLKEYYEVSPTTNTIHELVKENMAYEHIYSPSSLENRFLLEDIPMGLIPMAEFGKLAGIPTPKIDSVINFSASLIGPKIFENARTLKALGLENMSLNQLKETVHTEPKEILKL